MLVRPPDVVDLSAQREGKVLAGLAKPTPFGEIGPHARQVEQVSFAFRTIRTPRMASVWISQQRRRLVERCTRQLLIQEVSTLAQSPVQLLPTCKRLPLQTLSGPKLVAALGQALVGGSGRTTKHDRHAQSDQPQVQAGWERRFAAVVDEDRIMVHLQALRQSPIRPCQAQRGLVIGCIGMASRALGSQPYWVAQQTQMSG